MEPQDNYKILKLGTDLDKSMIIATNNGKFLVRFRDDQGLNIKKKLFFLKLHSTNFKFTF